MVWGRSRRKIEELERKVEDYERTINQLGETIKELRTAVNQLTQLNKSLVENLNTVKSDYEKLEDSLAAVITYEKGKTNSGPSLSTYIGSIDNDREKRSDEDLSELLKGLGIPVYTTSKTKNSGNNNTTNKGKRNKDNLTLHTHRLAKRARSKNNSRYPTNSEAPTFNYEAEGTGNVLGIPAEMYEALMVNATRTWFATELGMDIDPLTALGAWYAYNNIPPDEALKMAKRRAAEICCDRRELAGKLKEIYKW